MGSVFKNATVKNKCPVTQRQERYFNARKTDRPRNKKNEQALQIEMCDWMREVIPGVHFRSDTASGAFNSQYEKETHNRQQSTDSEPDITIFAARRGYHALIIELKADGVSLKMKRNGTKIRVRRDKRGRIVERDYKIRLKGDWSSLHIEKQHTVLEQYREAGYCAVFAVGKVEFQKWVRWYFELPVPTTLL